MKSFKEWIEYFKSLCLEDWEEIEFHFKQRIHRREELWNHLKN